MHEALSSIRTPPHTHTQVFVFFFFKITLGTALKWPWLSLWGTHTLSKTQNDEGSNTGYKVPAVRRLEQPKDTGTPSGCGGEPAARTTKTG
jgi:hypothetical protein